MEDGIEWDDVLEGRGGEVMELGGEYMGGYRISFRANGGRVQVVSRLALVMSCPGIAPKSRAEECLACSMFLQGQQLRQLACWG